MTNVIVWLFFFFLFCSFLLEFGLFNYILIINGGLIMSALVMEKLSIPVIFPVSQCDLHFTSSQKGILGSAGYFGILVSSHLWGYLADTKGRRCIIQPTLLIASLIAIISSFAQNFYLLTILRFLNGFLWVQYKVQYSRTSWLDSLLCFNCLVFQHRLP